MVGERALMTTRPRWWATTNNKSVRRMIRAATKRARVARAMVNEGGGQQRGRGQQGPWRQQQGWHVMKREMATATRVMVTRVAGKLQKTWAIATAMTTAMTWAMAMVMRWVGNEEGKGKGGKGNGDGNVRVMGDKEGNGSKAMAMATMLAGKWTVMVTKRAMTTVMRGAGKQQHWQ